MIKFGMLNKIYSIININSHIYTLWHRFYVTRAVLFAALVQRLLVAHHFRDVVGRPPSIVISLGVVIGTLFGIVPWANAVCALHR